MQITLPSRTMVLRLITGFTIGLLGLGCICAGGWLLLLMLLIVVTIGSLEFVRILNHKGFYPFKSTIILISIAFLFVVSFKRYDLVAVFLSLGTVLAFLSVIFRGRQPYIVNVATTVLGFIYCGWMPAHIIMIRQLDSIGLGFFNFEMSNGVIYLLMFFFGVLSTDVGAFYFGKKFGKIKLAPIISPNKTVEGSLGGALSALIVCSVIGLYTGLVWYHIIILSLLITIFAQLGDLGESLLKRDAGVKDSGDALPGHGGFLDRTDGYIFTAPVVYYYVNYFIVHHDSISDFIEFIKKVSNVFGF